MTSPFILKEQGKSQVARIFLILAVMYECEKWHLMSGCILMCWDGTKDYMELPCQA